MPLHMLRNIGEVRFEGTNWGPWLLDCAERVAADLQSNTPVTNLRQRYLNLLQYAQQYERSEFFREHMSYELRLKQSTYDAFSRDHHPRPRVRDHLYPLLHEASMEYVLDMCFNNERFYNIHAFEGEVNTIVRQLDRLGLQILQAREHLFEPHHHEPLLENMPEHHAHPNQDHHLLCILDTLTSHDEFEPNLFLLEVIFSRVKSYVLAFLRAAPVLVEPRIRSLFPFATDEYKDMDRERALRCLWLALDARDHRAFGISARAVVEDCDAQLRAIMAAREAFLQYEAVVPKAV